jgi:hyperosmotically inducible periplasmic protein
MRPLLLAVAASLVLVACDSDEPTKPAVVVTEPIKPPAQETAAAPPPAPAPVAAPQLSPDEALAKRITRELRDSPAVAGQGVDATVDGGVVTLYGTVPSAADRSKVADFVAGIEGVRSVVNKLVVVAGS